MVRQRHELCSDEPLLGDELELAGVTQQLGSDQHRDVLDVFTPIAGCLFSFEVGVDRHLGDAASTDGIDEIDGGGAAFCSDGFHG